MTHFFGLSVSLLVIFCSSLSQLQAASEVFYIKTNSHQCGTVYPCLTLSQFAANSSHYLHFNSTVILIFLPGTHHLSKVMTLSNMESFTMKTDNSTAQIQCKEDRHIYFSQSLSIHITNLEFIECPVTLKYVAEFVVENSKFEGRGTALELFETTAAQIINSTFDNVTSKESILESMSSNVTIVASEFDSNTALNHEVLMFSFSIVTIEASEFRDNFASLGSILVSINSIIMIEASEFDGNVVRVGGILSLFSSSVMIEGSKFDSNNLDVGGVLSSIDNTTITVGDCNFTNNTSSGGTVFMRMTQK